MGAPRLVGAAVLAVALVACRGGGGGGGPAPQDFQAAELVIGQPDFTSAEPNRGGAPSAAGVRFPVGDAAWSGGSLALPDSSNHRVLEYAAVPARSGAPADLVRGQADDLGVEPSLEAGRYHRPRSVWREGATLVVADAGAGRVLLGAGAGATVVGWGPGDAYRTGCAADLLAEPWRAIVAGGRLIVADRANHRVLIWNQVPAAAGTPADLVLGQKDLAHCAPNDGLGLGASGGRSAATLRDPADVWSDGRRLLVADRGNNRVLLWSRFPTASGAPADVVLGQADFRTAAAQTTRDGLRGPEAVTSDGTSIVVADTRNHRVLRWGAFPAASGAPADQVLGQRDFRHGAANDDDQDGAAGGPTARTLNLPTGVAFAGSHLVVTDTYNHRYLLFRVR